MSMRGLEFLEVTVAINTATTLVHHDLIVLNNANHTHTKNAHAQTIHTHHSHTHTHTHTHKHNKPTVIP